MSMRIQSKEIIRSFKKTGSAATAAQEAQHPYNYLYIVGLQEPGAVGVTISA